MPNPIAGRRLAPSAYRKLKPDAEAIYRFATGNRVDWMTLNDDGKIKMRLTPGRVEEMVYEGRGYLAGFVNGRGQKISP